MTSDFWQAQLDRCPAMRPWLLRAARCAVKRERLPATLTLGAIPRESAVRQALDALFGGCREERGRLRVRLNDALRDRAGWLPLAALLGVAPVSEPTESAAATLARAVRRLKLLHPEETSLLERLKHSTGLRRYCASAARPEQDLVALFNALAVLRASPNGTTLSELGAKSFNDSKALRSGALPQQLASLLRLRLDMAPEATTAEVFREAGVVENPFTTHAVVGVPFVYQVTDGTWFDWPARLWERREAAVMSWQTVRAIVAVRCETPCPMVVTSENAAPFLWLVERERVAALYTEGYPNAAVKTLLAHFARAGCTAQHWGDTDLDGYRIAAQVGRQIATQLYPVAHDTLGAQCRPLTPAQRARAERYIETHPEFPYLPELRRTLRRGWLEQEHSVGA